MTATAFDVLVDSGAEQDLREIAAYLAEHGTRGAAREWTVAILGRIETLEHFPERGSRPRELEESGSSRYRQILHGRYRIFYRIGERQVTILLVADGRRDIAALLRARLLGSGASG